MNERMLKRAEYVKNAYPGLVEKPWKIAFQRPRNR
jgi:hypothetical protein